MLIYCRSFLSDTFFFARAISIYVNLLEAKPHFLRCNQHQPTTGLSFQTLLFVVQPIWFFFRAQAPLIIASYPEFGVWNPLCLLINQDHPQIEAPLPSLVRKSPHSVTSPTLPHFETRHFLPTTSYPRKNVDQCWSYHQKSQELLTTNYIVIVMSSRLPRWSNNG